ncbi:MAG TPA: aldo/keto reductase [Chitinophagaceae bacterium]|nr:aldo/keto reductase [Chitinophagaceae bacterium]
MEKRLLGKTGIQVSPLIFGGNVFGWTVTRESEVFSLLDLFAAEGFNMIDTADSYSRWVPGNKGGESEQLIGKWLKGRKDRQSLVIATKVGSDMGQGKKDLSRKHIIHSADESLQRLQTEYIDLYQAHYDDPSTPIEETLEAFQILIKSGKVRAIGASNFSAERLEKALELSSIHGYPRYESLQPEYNLYSRQTFETGLLPLCLEKNLGVIPYYSLAGGFLSGKFRTEADLSKTPRGKGALQYMNERGMKILDALDKVAEEYSVSQAAIALAWLISRPTIVAPIASSTSADQLKGLIQGASLKLNAHAMNMLDQASS